LSLPKYEALNIHGSLLPKYRGGAPIQYAILNGDQQTGVSLMKMVSKMDAGPVFSTRKVAISPRETTGSLFLKIAQLGQEIIREDLEKIAKKELVAIEQDSQAASFAYNISSEEEKVD
jgi:methionyl-tRNA formyltransferase